MERRIAALIIIFIVSLLIGLAMNQKPEQPSTRCPDVCNDGNICTYDYCSPQTSYKCSHQTILPCCGNGICEANEDCGLDCR